MKQITYPCSPFHIQYKHFEPYHHTEVCAIEMETLNKVVQVVSKIKEDIRKIIREDETNNLPTYISEVVT